MLSNSMDIEDDDLNLSQPLTQTHHSSSSTIASIHDQKVSLCSRVWIESKKLWLIVGPSIFNRLSVYSMTIITIVFSGHLGDVQLASMSIAIILITGFNFSLMLGMASALETLCGQAFGAKSYRMLGVYLQRSWIVLFFFSFFLVPIYIFATPILKLLGQPDDVAEMAGLVACWLIPLHFSLAFELTLSRFLQSQVKTKIVAYVSFLGLLVNVLSSWLCVYVFDLGVVGLAIAMDVSWWVLVLGLFVYVTCGGCPLTWTGFSVDAFCGLWEFFKLSVASGVMLCLENWYYRILILMTGYLPNSTIALDALAICMNINGLEMMIPLAFFAGTGVRIGNELGAGNGKGAKFATTVSVVQSSIIGLFFCVLVMVLRDKIALIFSSSDDVLQEVNVLADLLAVTILLNSVQPVLSGVAVGSGWQASVAYINLGCYYLVGLPLGLLMGWVFDFGVRGIWGEMIFGGTAVQTVILAVITIRCNWEEQAEKARLRVQEWSSPRSNDQP